MNYARINRDEISVNMQTGYARVDLAVGRAYLVKLAVCTDRTLECTADHVVYWAVMGHEAFGPTRDASATDKASSIGGRIWALLVAANLA